MMENVTKIDGIGFNTRYCLNSTKQDFVDHFMAAAHIYSNLSPEEKVIQLEMVYDKIHEIEFPKEETTAQPEPTEYTDPEESDKPKRPRKRKAE